MVSIHAPWEGCDQSGLLTDNRDVRFNSRTLGRVRLARILSNEIPAYVSIHAPWEGCDYKRAIKI